MIKSAQHIVEVACNTGAAKARLTLDKQIVLSVLAGAYIALSGLLALAVGGGNADLAKANPGLARLAFGAGFPLGFILVAIAGGELFTENCAMMISACLVRAAKWRALLRGWGLVYVGNLIGALLLALFMGYLAGFLGQGDLARASVGLAEAKVGLGWGQALLYGVGGGWLSCLAVWLAFSSQDTLGKIVGLWLPTMALATLGWSHAVADTFFIPLGMFGGAQVSVLDFLWRALLPVTLGNIIGSAGLVGALYWWIYSRD